MPLTIGYSSGGRVITKATLLEAEDHVEFLLPPLPRVIRFMSVALPLLGPTGCAILVFHIVKKRNGMPIPVDLLDNSKVIGAIVLNSIVPLVAVVASALAALREIKFGHLPHIGIHCDGHTVTITSHGMIGMRHRLLPIADIRAIEVMPVRDIFGRSTFKFVLRMIKGWPIAYPFSTDDPGLPAEIESAFLKRLSGMQQLPV